MLYRYKRCNCTDTGEDTSTDGEYDLLLGEDHNVLEGQGRVGRTSRVIIVSDLRKRSEAALVRCSRSFN
jgi:hypothetical protein